MNSPTPLTDDVQRRLRMASPPGSGAGRRSGDAINSRGGGTSEGGRFARHRSPTKLEGFSIDGGDAPRHHHHRRRLQHHHSDPYAAQTIAPAAPQHHRLAYAPANPNPTPRMYEAIKKLPPHAAPNSAQGGGGGKSVVRLPPRDESAIDETEDYQFLDYDDDDDYGGVGGGGPFGGEGGENPHNNISLYSVRKSTARFAGPPDRYVGEAYLPPTSSSFGGVGGLYQGSRASYGKRRGGGGPAGDDIIGGPFFDTTSREYYNDREYDEYSFLGGGGGNGSIVGLGGGGAAGVGLGFGGGEERQQPLAMEALLAIAGLLESQGLNPMADPTHYEMAMHHRAEEAFLRALSNAMRGSYVTRYHRLKRDEARRMGGAGYNNNSTTATITNGSGNALAPGRAIGVVKQYFYKATAGRGKDPVDRFIRLALEEPSPSYRRHVNPKREFPMAVLEVCPADSPAAEVISSFRLSNLVGVTRDVSGPNYAPHRVYADGSVGPAGVAFEDEPTCPDPDSCTVEAQHEYKQRQLALLAALRRRVVGLRGKRLTTTLAPSSSSTVDRYGSGNSSSIMNTNSSSFNNTTATAAATNLTVSGSLILQHDQQLQQQQQQHALLHADNAFTLWFFDANTRTADQLVLCAHSAQSAAFWVNVMKGILAVNSSRRLPIPVPTPYNFGGRIGLGAAELSMYHAIEAGGGGSVMHPHGHSPRPSSHSSVVGRGASTEALSVGRRHPPHPHNRDTGAYVAEQMANNNPNAIAADGSSGVVGDGNAVDATAAANTDGDGNSSYNNNRATAEQLAARLKANEEKFMSRYYIPRRVATNAAGEAVGEDGLTAAERAHIRAQKPPVAFLFRKARYLIDVDASTARFFEAKE